MRTSKRIAAHPTASMWLVSATVMAVVAAGWAAGHGSGAYLATVGVIALAALLYPPLLLATVAAFSLSGGAFTDLANASNLSLLLLAVVRAPQLKLADRSSAYALIAPLCLLGWLAFRVVVGSGWAFVGDFIVPIAAVIVAYEMTVRRAPLPLALALGGIIFVIASTFLGTYDPTGLRFEGISGDPNRMVMGLLIFIPFLVQVALSNGTLVIRAASIAATAQAVLLVTRSGSEQGSVGLAALGVMGMVVITRKAPKTGLVWVGALATVSILWVASAPGFWDGVSDDTRTLSGRSETYSAGIRVLEGNALFGTGSSRVSEDAVVDRSVHNAAIGIAVSGGVLAGVTWLWLLLVSVRNGWLAARSGLFIGAAPVSLFLSQLVQTVQFVSLTWLILTYFLFDNPSNRTSES